MANDCYCLHPKCICLYAVNISHSKESLEEFCRATNEIEVPIITLFGLAACASFLSIIILSQLYWKGKRHYSAARGYLLSLSICHCIITIIGTMRLSFSHDVIRGKFYNWRFALAQGSEAIFYALNFCGVIVILGLSADRYVAVCRPHKYSFIEGYRKMKIVVAMAYILPIIVYTPNLFYEVPRYDNTHHYWYLEKHTYPYSLYWKIWKIFINLIHQAVPGVLIVVFNMNILLSVVRLGKIRKSITSNFRVVAMNQKEKRIIYVLLAITLNFLLTSIPSASFVAIYSWLGDYCYFNPEHIIPFKVIWCLELVGFTTDSILYFVMDREYRNTFCHLVQRFCHCCKTQASEGSER